MGALLMRRRRPRAGGAGRAKVTTGIVLDGLLAEWRFDDGAGTQLTDYSGNGNHGTLPAAPNQPVWVAEGLDFDGVSGGGGDYVDIAAPGTWESIDIAFAPDGVISAATSPRQCLFSANDSGVLLGTSSGQLVNEIVTLKQNSQGFAVQGSRAWTHASDTISAAWHLVQCVRDAGDANWSIYLDGAEIDNATGSGGPPLQEMLNIAWRIGQATGPVDGPFNGKIAWINLYSSKLTADQLAQNRSALTDILALRGITLP